jgi:AcrR family transcriptional regulator
VERNIPGAQVQRTIELLWRDRRPRGARRGPRARVGVDDIVEAAIDWADENGLASLTMRELATKVGVKPMTLYSHVPDKATLLMLMMDRAFGAFSLVLTESATGSERLRAVIEANYRHYIRHPWLARSHNEQPPLGPGSLAKYERELSALVALGLSDEDTDAVLAFVLNFTRSSALNALTRAQSETTNKEWWETVGPFLQQVVGEDEFPLASRIGSVAGASLMGAYNSDHEYRFGTERIVDAVAIIRSPASGNGWVRSDPNR